MRKITAKLVVLFILSLFFICSTKSYGANMSVHNTLNKTLGSKKQKIAIIITSLRLRKENGSSFNYSMVIGYKNTGSVTLDGQYLKKEVKVKTNNQWVYLNGGTTPGAMIKPGVLHGVAIPINIKCDSSKIMTHMTPAMSKYRDFMVDIFYKGRKIAEKKLYKQKVCTYKSKPNFSSKGASNLLTAKGKKFPSNKYIKKIKAKIIFFNVKAGKYGGYPGTEVSIKIKNSSSLDIPANFLFAEGSVQVNNGRYCAHFQIDNKVPKYQVTKIYKTVVTGLDCSILKPASRMQMKLFYYNQYHKKVILDKKTSPPLCFNKKSQLLHKNVSATSKNRYRLLPDLTVTKIELDKNCNIWATIKNNGPGTLPDYSSNAGNSAIRFYVGSKNNGYILSYIDKDKKLQQPGGTLKVEAPGVLSHVPALHRKNVRVVVDAFANLIKETNENNNEMTKSLMCTKGAGINKSSVQVNNKAVSYAEKNKPIDFKTPPEHLMKVSNITTNLTGDNHIEITISFSEYPDIHTMNSGFNVYSTKRERYDQTQATHLVADKRLSGSFSRVSGKVIKWTSYLTNICNTEAACNVYITYDSRIKDVWGRALDADRDGNPGGFKDNFYYIIGSGKP